MFISQLYEESISDKQIVKRAGFLETLKKIEAGDLNKGDSIMADKGFDIGDDFKKIDLKLDIPPLIKDQAAGLTNGRSTDNVRTDCGFDRSNFPLAGHVDRSKFNRTENEINLRFLLFSCTTTSTTTWVLTCQHPHCRTCGHISSETDLLGPKDPLTIKDSFTCLSSGLIYCISCRRCPVIYIGETGRTLRERFGEHLRSINKIAPGFPVAEHFSSNGHTAADALVRGIKLCEGKRQRKQQEMRLIFRLGTCQLRDLNADFQFI